MNDREQKKTVSPQKLAANRKNAKSSTGPRTPKGKQRASQNRYEHGFYSKRLFPTKELIDRDWADYHRIYAAYWDHYSPVGDLEKLCVEQIAVQALRLARLLGHEQEVLGWGAPFESRSVDKIVRYESNVSRHLEKAIDLLEGLQEEREAESDQLEPSDFEEPPDVSTSSNLFDASPTTAQPHVETSAKQGSAPTDAAPPNVSAETAPSTPPQSLVKVVEQAMNPAPSEQHKSSLGSGENYGTDPIGSSRFIETAEDEELVERIKRGDDLEQLE